MVVPCYKPANLGLGHSDPSTVLYGAGGGLKLEALVGELLEQATQVRTFTARSLRQPGDNALTHPLDPGPPTQQLHR